MSEQPGIKGSKAGAELREKLLSEKKYTDGPWTWDVNDAKIVINSAVKFVSIVNIHRGEQKFSVDWDEARANAHLIAAAPEMLEALELAEIIIKQISVTELKRFIGDGLLLGDSAETIRSAIKKANGESP